MNQVSKELIKRAAESLKEGAMQVAKSRLQAISDGADDGWLAARCEENFDALLQNLIDRIVLEVARELKGDASRTM